MAAIHFVQEMGRPYIAQACEAFIKQARAYSDQLLYTYSTGCNMNSSDIVFRAYLPLYKVTLFLAFSPLLSTQVIDTCIPIGLYMSMPYNKT